MSKRKELARLSRALVALMIVTLALTSCAPAPAPTVALSSVALIINPDIKDVLSGQTVALTVDANGSGLRYKWSVSRGKLSAFDAPAVIYTAPDTLGADAVTVEVTSASGTTTKNASFNIIASPTRTPVPTPPPPPATFLIAAPFNKVVCPIDKFCTFPVAGTLTGIAPDPNLKVVVFVKNEPGLSDKWWPHQQALIIRNDDAWQAQAQIGDVPCTGIKDDFQIVALLMTADQASKINAEWQVLPQGYAAKSNIVDLITAYDPLTVDLSFASASSDISSTISLATSNSTLDMNYDLGAGGWVLIAVPLYRNLSCMKQLKAAVSFSYEGAGAANSFEVKLEDADGTNFGWITKPRESVANKTFSLPFSDFTNWVAGNSPGMNWGQVKNLLFAISKKAGDEGSRGRIIIKDVMITP